MPIVIGPASPRHSLPPPGGLGYRVPLASGEAGTAQTIDVMRRLVDDAVSDESFVNHIGRIVRSSPPFDETSQLHAIYDWFRRNIRFVRDPLTKEKLIPPAALLELGHGDCDCVATAIGAAAIAVGFPARWITISTNAEDPGEFTHIYTQAESPAGSGNWITLDTARPDSQFGLEPAFYFRKRAWNIADDHYEDLSGTRHRLPKFLSGYLTLGQDWQQITQQSISEIPTIIAATSGHGTATSPYATYSSPYSSYATEYTPGYGVPAAGYTATGYPPTTAVAGISMTPMTWLLIGLAALFLMRKK